MYNSTWTEHDDWLFVNAVAKFSFDIGGRWLELANAIPGKTAEEVKAYYEAVEHDLLEIEAGRVELTNYPNDDDKEDKLVVKSDAELILSKRGEKERKKATPWSVEEHRRFLQGLDVYGKGDWRSISRNMVVTRTPTQVASHAQKYFFRQASLKEEDKNNKKRRKRCSIHEISTAVVVQAQPCSTPPSTSLNGGQGRGAPQPVTNVYGGRGEGAASHPTSGQQGGAPPRYEFMTPNDYSQDEEFGFKNSSYLSETIFE